MENSIIVFGRLLGVKVCTAKIVVPTWDDIIANKPFEIGDS